MTACFDTSVLIPALVDQLPNHEACFSTFLRATSVGRQAICSTHAIAELYSVLTALPLARRVSPSEAREIIEESIIPRLRIVELDIEDYRWALRAATEAGLAGGAVYDALHVAAARKAGGNCIYTYNVRHFQALAPSDIAVSAP